MAKVDKQNRLVIPKSVMDISDTNFCEEVRIFINGAVLYFDNPSTLNSSDMCLGKINFDEHNRFFLSKLTREFANIKVGDIISFYLLNGKVTFKKLSFNNR